MTTFTKNPKDSAEDRISVEIGDAKQPDFKPQVKLMRWDNEVNFSARLVDSDPLTVKEKNGRVIAETGKKQIDFYELPKSQDHPEGGFEMEITLKEKPISNVLEFTLQTKGLEFFYQPEITDAQAAPLAAKKGITLLEAKRYIRPERVVGSYAVFHQENKNHVLGGKNYGSGKAFHIYRPQIEDANGVKVWGDLNISEGLMTVTIPQAFLDTAAYPVRHAAGATFGYTTLGASQLGPSQNKLFGSKFTSPANMGTVVNVSHAICNDLANGDSFKIVVAKVSDLNIVTNGVSNASGMHLDGDGFANHFTFVSFATPPTLAASTDYVLFVIHNDPDWANYSLYDTGASAQYYFDGSNSYATPTNPTDAVTTGDDNGAAGTAKLSIFLTYTPATVQTLTVSGDGTRTGWDAEGYDYTRLQSDDDGTTKIYSPTANDIVTFALTDTSGLSGATIHSFTVYGKYSSLDPNTSNTMQLVVRHGGTNYFSPTMDTNPVSATYLMFSYTWTTNPGTGLAWTTSDLDAVQIGIKKINGAGGRASYFRGEVEYTAGGVVAVPLRMLMGMGS